LLRKIATAVVMIPLAILLIAFAVANHQDVRISFDPFDPAQPAYSLTMWLFVPILLALILGVLIGGFASWLRQGRWRGSARRFERELRGLRDKVATLEGAAGNSTGSAQRQSAPERLKLRPPAG
jgi:uncharacterized integral membrane protein